jgi:glycosyltransferase involved in cell wall biosynthesis
MKINILYLSESSLPKIYTHSIVSEGEARILRDTNLFNNIFVIAIGKDFVGKVKGKTESKIIVVRSKRINPFIDFVPFVILYFLYNFLYFVPTLKLIRKYNIKIIHTTSLFYSGLVGFLLHLITKLPYVVEVRANFEYLLNIYLKFIPVFLKRAIVRSIILLHSKKSSFIIANSNIVKELLINNGAARHKVDVVYPVVFYYDEEKLLGESVRVNNKDMLVISTLSRIVKEKGLDILLDLAKEIKKHKLNVKIVIGGTGPYLNNLIKKAKEYNITDIVKFAYYVSDKISFYQRADIIINPWLYYDFGGLNTEAMLIGKPIIAFLPHEPIIHGFNGLIIERDVISLLNAIKLFFDDKLRYEYGCNGKSLYLKKYSKIKQINKMKNLYSKLIVSLGEKKE